MTTEVAGLRPGVLRIRDLKAVGPELATMHHVDVLVLGGIDEPPFAGRILLGRKPSGRGDHIALLCPRCGEPCFELRLKDGELVCSRDAPKRTRHQAEHHLAHWRFGDVDEDRLLRLVQAGRARLPAGVALARELLDRIVAADADRFASILPRIRAALEVQDVT